MALIDNLVSYYKLETNSNDIVSWYNWTDTSISYVSWKIGNAASFNWSSSLINLPSSIDSQVSTAISWCWWVYFNTVAGAQYIYVLNNADSPEVRIINSAWVISFLIYDSWAYQCNISSTTTLVASWWYYISCTWTTNDFKLYINWTQEATGTSWSFNIDWAPTHSLWYYSSAPTQKLNWRLDEVGIWSRALTAWEVTQLYNWWSGLAYPLSSWNSNFFMFF